MSQSFSKARTAGSTASKVQLVAMDESRLDDVVQVHLRTFPAYMNSQLGRSYLREFLLGFLRHPSAITRVAVDQNSKVLGYLAGAPIEATGAMNRALVPAAARAVLCQPWLLFTSRIRMTAWQKVLGLVRPQTQSKPAPDLPSPALSLVSIGVDPDSRGQGIGEMLVEWFESEARRRSYQSLRLSVYPSNQSARKFYARLNWQPFQEAVPEGHAMYYYKILL